MDSGLKYADRNRRKDSLQGGNDRKGRPGDPRWKEEPRYVLDLIQTYINNQTYQWGLNSFYRGAAKAEDAIKRITEKVQQIKGRRKARQVEQLLRNYREVAGLREHSKFFLTQLYQVCRELLLEIGEELKEEGQLDEPMDISLLPLL